MNLNKPPHRKYIYISAIILALILFIGILPVFVFDTHPLLSLANYFLDVYLSIAENISNYILRIFNSDIKIVNHKIIFPEATEYVIDNKEIIENWTKYVLFKKWTVLLLFLFWATLSSIKKKIIYTGFLLLTHFISVISGLILITAIGPLVVISDNLTQLQPNTIGAIAMISLLAIWVKDNLPEIQNTLNKLRINIKLQKKIVNKIIVIFIIYSLLKNFIVPYFNFFFYIEFLLSATRFFVSFFGYGATIEGPYLIGNGGSLYMAKWCLGFLTMYTFASLVFITSNRIKVKWIYILSGIIFLHIVNIIRLAALFIFVQNNNSMEMADNHHAIYNIIVYIIIFILWVIWFERFADKKSIRRKA